MKSCLNKVKTTAAVTFFSIFTKVTFVTLIILYSTNLFAQWTNTGTNIYNTNSGMVGIGSLPSFQGKLSISSDGSIPHIWLTGGPTFTSTSLLSKWNLKTSSGNASLGLICSDGSGNNGYGLLSGADLASPIVWMYNSSLGGNAFTVAVKSYAASISGIDNYMTPLFQVRQNGSVGIGTTNTGSYKLAVEGKIVARTEVRVLDIGQSFPDYVFEKDYNLRPLSEVEKFIEANHHLPEVPTATEVASEGIDLVEMNITTLKKVEELTLYLIELNKQMEQLKLENASLKEKVNQLSK